MDKNEILKELGEEDIAKLLCGKDSATQKVGELPSLKISRGGFYDGGSDLPSAAAIACSFDRDVAYAAGRDSSLAYCVKGVHAAASLPLLPFSDKRSGVRAQSLSSDRLLSAELCGAYIDGMQSSGVGACMPLVPFGEPLSADGLSYAKKALSLGLVKPRAVIADCGEKIGGEHAGESLHAAGFDGVVISEWGSSVKKPTAGGADLIMPNGDEKSGAEKRKASAYRKSAERVLELIDECYDDHIYEDDEQACVRRERYAAECVVLLKNDGVLPLLGDSVTVIGSLAYGFPTAPEEGGKKREGSLIEALKEDRRVKFVDGYGESENAVEEALEQTFPDETVIVVVGSRGADCFGHERDEELEEKQMRLIERLEESGREVIAIAVGGGALDLKRISVSRALLYVPYLGSGGAVALKRIVCGEVAPSARLCEDFFYTDRGGAKKILYPFGYGLSYGSFGYDDAVRTKNGVSVTVVNEGRYSTAEVVQIYEKTADGFALAGFEKVRLRAGESRRVNVSVRGGGELFVGANRRDMILKAEGSPAREEETRPATEAVQESKAADGKREKNYNRKLVAKLKKLALAHTDGDGERAERLALGACSLPPEKLVSLSNGQISKSFIDSCLSGGPAPLSGFVKKLMKKGG